MQTVRSQVLAVWPMRMLQLMATVLLLSVGYFVVSTIHWPLVGDASLMHYVTLLMGHGRVPYRDILDMNFPASYLPDWIIVHLFGVSALPWRIYDLALLAAAAAAMVLIAGQSRWFPALWAGCLFALIHGRDGLNQVGQRDLTAGVLLLAGVAGLLWGARTGRTWTMISFGAGVGLAAMVKPTLAPFLLLGLSDLYIGAEFQVTLRRRFAMTFAGGVVPVLACAGWLWAKGGLGAFWYVVHVLAPYHASLGHASWSFLLRDLLSPVAPVIVVWLIVLGMDRLPGRPPHVSSQLSKVERRTLLWGVGLGMFSYLVQLKGYPYHRYPFLLFLLLIIGMDLTDALADAGLRRGFAMVTLMWAALVLGPSSALKAGGYNWRDEEFREMLEADLTAIQQQRNGESLSGRVQCLDTISGCIDVLYNMQLVQDSGLMYDEFVFHPGGARAVDDTRAIFWRWMQADPPVVFVVSDPLFPTGPNGYAKVAQWPAFSHWLNAGYQLVVERHPSLLERWVGRPIIPLGYRVYVRRE